MNKLPELDGLSISVGKNNPAVFEKPSSTTLNTSPLTAEQYIKVIVPEVTSPIKLNSNDLNPNVYAQNFIENSIDQSEQYTDCNVLRKVAELTAESLGVKANHFKHQTKNYNAKDHFVCRKNSIIEFQSMLKGLKFDLKNSAEFEDPSRL
ncbi:hypothetical protein QR98_0062510 [Sarcoptes scabiei]|uniref:Uncharacterized protein n=1 Tax=Sarcoptes scabiei TaxID=52283 RepID=A0A132A9S1_SARSC|nr:hypothetical protein QR98_0062510 [Sarcoptes scabiei]